VWGWLVVGFMLIGVLPTIASPPIALATQLARQLLDQSPDQRVWRGLVQQKQLEVTHAYVPPNPSFRFDITHSASNSQPSWGSDFEWDQPLVMGNRQPVLAQEAGSQLALTQHQVRIDQLNRYADILQSIVAYDIARQSWTMLHHRMPDFQDLMRFAQSRPQQSIQEQVDVAILTAFFHDLSVSLHQRHTAMTAAKLAIGQWGDFSWEGAIQRPPLPPQLPPIALETTPQMAYWALYRHQLNSTLQKWHRLNDPSVSLMLKSSLPFTANNGGATTGVGLVVTPAWHHQTKGQLATTQVALDHVDDQEASVRRSLQHEQSATWHDYESAMWVLKEGGEQRLRATTRSFHTALQGFRRGLVSAVSVVELGRLLMQQEERYTSALYRAHMAHINWGRWQEPILP